MHISFAVFADGANLSQEGKLNVLGVFDALAVSGFPSMHPRTHFVVRLKGSADDVGPHRMSFSWVNPADEVLWSSDGDLNVAPGPNPAFEMDLPIIAVIDLPLTMPGLYTMQVGLDGVPTAEVRLHVTNTAQVVMPPPSGMFSLEKPYHGSHGLDHGKQLLGKPNADPRLTLSLFVSVTKSA